MNFIRKYVLHNAGLKLISLAAAVLLWMAVAREPIAEVAVNVPIEFQNVPENLEISSETIPQAQVRVRGPARLVRDVSQAGVHAIIDLTGSKPGTRTFELGPARIQSPGEVQVMQVIPTRLQLELDLRATRQVEVRPRVIGTFASGIRIARVTADPAVVTIVGPAQRVDAVEAATTDPVDATGVVGRQTFSSHVYVTDPLVRVTNADPVHVTVITEKMPGGGN
jgi:YbbR domain-containing protein